jgi:hypothetical protein
MREQSEKVGTRLMAPLRLQELPGTSMKSMARATGLEPATSGVTGRHSNQLSYARAEPLHQRHVGGLRGALPPVKHCMRPQPNIVGKIVQSLVRKRKSQGLAWSGGR